MGDGVKEAVLLLVTANFSHQKNCIRHQSRDQQSKQDDAKNKRHHLAPMENNPADVQRDRCRNQARSQHDEKRHRFRAAGYAHAL